MLLVAAVVLLAVSMLFGGAMGSLYGIFVLTGMVCAVAAIFICVTYCKCPHCGKRIFVGVLTRSDCPHCRKNLYSGKKSKKR